MHATPEQEQAIALALGQDAFKIMAFAGSGKTTTLRLISEAMPARRGLYLAFNKAIADEARSKFGPQVDCRTFHSLAFRHVDRQITDKLRLPRLSPARLAEQYRLLPQQVRRRINGRYEFFILRPSQQAMLITRGLSQFCSTHARHPAPRHLPIAEDIHADDAQALRDLLYPLLEQRWLESLDPRHRAGISHEIYLKCWALSEPRIPADYILFDEAQDSDPIMLGVLMNQPSQVVYVGDPHQQIYQWRGAVNAMQRLPLPDSRLTRSFRFGESVADLANIFLQELGESVPLQGNPQQRSEIDLSPLMKKKDAILCRTNARAMALLMGGLVQGHRVALQADTDKLLRFVEGAAALRLGRRCSEVPELALFDHWREVQEYCEAGEGSDMKPLVKLIDEHGTEVLRQALQKATDVTQADYVISTAHKAKGLEWDRVQIEDDYNHRIIKNRVQISADELRLLYVAITRAKIRLNVHHLWPMIQTLKKSPAAPTHAPDTP